MRRLTMTAALAAITIAPAAHADWQYTKWGMTPEEVVDASEGTVELLPTSKRPRIPPLETAAFGAFLDGKLMLRTTFSFTIDGGGLACVFYGVASHDSDDALRQTLTKRYGPPHVSELAAIGLQNLDWETATDEIRATFAKDDPGYAMHCAKKKE